MQINPDDIQNILRETAQTCILPYYKQLKDDQIDTKSGPGDLVTIADKTAEDFITKELKALFPDHIIFGEESFYEHPELSETIASAGKTPIWVIDPVDGTYNFAHGKRHFAILLACVVNGETQHGWIYDIIGDSFIYAGKGQGAYLDGAKIENTPFEKPLSEAFGFAAAQFFKKDRKQGVHVLADNVAEQTTLRCSAHEYWQVATGKAQYLVSTKMKPWDHLAGTLIVEEAGGHVRKYDYDTYNINTGHEGSMIVATNEKIWNDIYDVTAGYFKPA